MAKYGKIWHVNLTKHNRIRCRYQYDYGPQNYKVLQVEVHGKWMYL